MATEASKTRSLWGPEVLNLLSGTGIDIGCGVDPITPNAERFDQEQGDANQITHHVRKQFDFVFSSHCLEHMRDPEASLKEWFSLVKPGGHLIILVPDEDLYEQGCFPSIFNSDHKHTFTVAKACSWSPKSRNLLRLARDLPGTIVNLELQDHGIDRKLLHHAPGPWARWLGRLYRKLSRRVARTESRVWLARAFRKLGAVIDQTDLGDLRLAQIQLIVKKG
jgi:SAM-dependent methyltransferase